MIDIIYRLSNRELIKECRSLMEKQFYPYAFFVALNRFEKLVSKNITQGDTVISTDKRDEILVTDWPTEGKSFSGVQLSDNGIFRRGTHSIRWVKSEFKLKA